MICPNCGYDIKEKKIVNFTPMIQILISDHSKSTQNAIWQIFKAVAEYTSIETKSMYFFLKDIKEVNERIIRYSINQFYTSGKYKSTNLQYLRSIILNNDKSKEKLEKVEKKIYGTKPPEKEVI